MPEAHRSSAVSIRQTAPQVRVFRNVIRPPCGGRAGGRQGRIRSPERHAALCARVRGGDKGLLSQKPAPCRRPPGAAQRAPGAAYFPTQTMQRGEEEAAQGPDPCCAAQRMLKGRATHLAVLKRKEEPGQGARMTQCLAFPSLRSPSAVPVAGRCPDPDPDTGSRCQSPTAVRERTGSGSSPRVPRLSCQAGLCPGGFPLCRAGQRLSLRD